MSDIVERLRGIYRVAITDGLGKVDGNLEPDNEREFVRRFPSPLIQIEAAQEIERLREALKPFADAGGMLPLTFGPDNEPVGDDEEATISCVGYPLGEVTAADLTRAYLLIYPQIEEGKP